LVNRGGGLGGGGGKKTDGESGHGSFPCQPGYQDG